MRNRDFLAAYDELEMRFKRLAEKENGIYIPDIKPRGPVDFIFVCMEPSLGAWAKNSEEAKNKIASGFINFIGGYTILILHYCIQSFLCNENQTYHITDFSKGAMLVKDAGPGRNERYDNWYPLLKEEIDLVASSEAKIFSVGKLVAESLRRHHFPRTFMPLIHYSGVAARHRNKLVQSSTKAFMEFKSKVTTDDFLSIAKNVIENSGPPDTLCQKALDRLYSEKLTLSGLKLMFNYRESFAKVQPVKNPGV